jgi:uncharacterized repeat protein (TIGR01451 family)
VDRRVAASFRRVVATLARVPVFAAALLAFAAPAHAAINANKSFTPDVVSVGQVSTVTLFFLNANTSVASALAFTDVLPTGIVVAPSPSPSTTCGGSLAANSGDTSVSFSGGAIPAAVGATPGTCQVTFNVVATASDVYINTIEAGDVTSSEGSNSQDAEATLNVTALAPLTGSKSFAPAVLHGYGDPSTVTITLNNPNGVALTNLTFTDILPAQLALSPTPVAATTCGGTLTPNTVASPNRVALAGGSIPANGSCTVTFGVIAAAPNAAANGNVQNTIPAGDITTFEGVTNPLITSNNLLLQTGAQLVKAFAPTTINSGGTSTLTVTVRNYNALAISPLGFSDPLPGVMRVAAAPNTGGTCVTVNGGSFSAAVPGAATYTTTGGSLPGVAPNAAANVFTSCTYTIDVTATNAATAPLALNNNILAGNFGGVAYANSNTATLTVVRPSTLSGSKSLTTLVGPAVQTNTILATVVINNLAAVPATNLAMTDLLTTMGARLHVRRGAGGDHDVRRRVRGHRRNVGHVHRRDDPGDVELHAHLPDPDRGQRRDGHAHQHDRGGRHHGDGRHEHEPADGEHRRRRRAHRRQGVQPDHGVRRRGHATHDHGHARERGGRFHQRRLHRHAARQPRGLDQPQRRDDLRGRNGHRDARHRHRVAPGGTLAVGTTSCTWPSTSRRPPAPAPPSIRWR